MSGLSALSQCVALLFTALCGLELPAHAGGLPAGRVSRRRSVQSTGVLSSYNAQVLKSHVMQQIGSSITVSLFVARGMGP